MWNARLPEANNDALDKQSKEYRDLLFYIENLADNKLGYPVSLHTYIGVLDNEVLGIKPHSLANILLNNVGDPFKDSETSLMEVKNHERILIGILARFYGIKEEDIRGYVTTGGTEGNFAALWWSKRYMINRVVNTLIEYDNALKIKAKEEQTATLTLSKTSLNDYQTRATLLQKIIDLKNAMVEDKNITQQLLTPTVFFTKGHTHYSIPKISEILKLNIRPIASHPDGSINLENFKKELMLNLGAYPHSSIIVIANIGTTITGAIDNVPEIKKILDNHSAKPHYTIHLDGALTGFVMPIIKPWGNIENYFDAIGANTLAVSAHKYPGLSQPCGIFLAKKLFFEKAFEKSERAVEYVGNILDVTITGSRSGLNVLMFYNALHALGLDKGPDVLQKMVDENMATARYLYIKLVEIYGPEHVEYPYQFNILFPKTSTALAKKYQLMLTGDKATVCILTNVTKELVDQFIIDLKLEKEKAMNMVKYEYKIDILTNEHRDSVIKLFTKTFCESEPITKHLSIRYEDYEPFVKDVVDKAIDEKLSVVALDKTGQLIACTIGEDITNPFIPNLSKYPVLKPVFELLQKLDEPFFKNRKFKKNKIIHIWIALVEKTARGHGLSTAIDMACAEIAVKKGFEFAYAEFTNPISQKITSHYNTAKCINEISYENFHVCQTTPFKGVKGGAAAYLISIKPGIKIESVSTCYIGS